MRSGATSFVGQKTTTLQENNKSSFAQTCNRLSQFLKERNSLGNSFSFHYNMDVPHHLDARGAKEVSETPTMKAVKSLDLFPLSSSSSTIVSQASTNNNDVHLRELPIAVDEPEKPKTSTKASMTIFYDGKVLVFDDVSEEKALEIMAAATQGTITSAQTQQQTQAPICLSETMAVTNNDNILLQGSSLNDLPIARINSLHRFMEKRRDRIGSAAPYQLKNMSSSRPERHHVKDFFCQQQLELKL